ncbi:MAG: hypothetical protein KJN90_09605 [Gammaproteobacteria bacterium]|nr:hypothetical protein [Gammaproteobacteria bacterium]
MNSENTEIQSRDTVGVFFATEPLEKAIQELRDVGIKPEDIGVLAEDRKSRSRLTQIKEKFNRYFSSRLNKDASSIRQDTPADTVHATFGGFSVAAFALIGAAVVALAGLSGNAYAVVTAACAVVAGTIALTAVFIRKTDAQRLNEQVDRGHIVLFARVRTDSQERQALEVLGRYSGLKAKVVPLENG